MPKIKKQHKFKIKDKVKILPRKVGQDNQNPLYTDIMQEEYEGKQAIITEISKKGFYMLNINPAYQWHPDWLELIDKKITIAIAKKIKNLNNIQSCKMLKKLQKHYK